ncbi:hypothetical protein ASPBRDRAFT_56812 [Aspergillus brasiliensis CBS 101740]|uniref:Methyltransferase domain-containing protein n=1 Tax=Aspergillus brasiliensis (strain CBS 101740 / IMI 381727 / IBT 21946) TaxID=767769 RepID=A0A1L9UEK7_ASPBC|nr:hypothetical protein ASPBRDRAFT_56812 [Aspergillus brasiliensis CBS 101740]
MIDTSVWFKAEIGARLKPCSRFVYREWSGIADKDLAPHLHTIRKRAWPLGEYPCIGLWMFLLPGLADFPQFPSLLSKAQEPQSVILDLGCGLGQGLRLLAAHGVPTDRMWAVDVEPGLWTLGYKLFRDAGRMHARFIQGDIQALPDESFSEIRGRVDLVIASQFLHLFSWDGQMKASKRIVSLSKPGTMLVGYQQARRRPREYIRPWGMMFYHNQETFTKLWDLVQKQTNTVWSLDVKEVDLAEWGMEPEDVEWMPEDRMGINFVITRLS